MKLQFLGVGGAFSIQKELYQSNMIITAKSGKRLLIDCGMTAPTSLMELGIHPGNIGKEIDAVYISHLHSDHIGGMEWLGFARFFIPPNIRPRLYANKDVMKDLWNKSLRGGMESLQGRKNDLTTYFEVEGIQENGSFIWENMEFKLVQTIHIMNGYAIVPSYGLLIKALVQNGGQEFSESIFITTDTQYAPNQISTFYDQADVIFQDCESTGFMKDDKWVPLKSGVHAHFEDLKTLPEKTKNKMWLYHYQNKQYMDVVKELGFQGFVEKHQEFIFGG